MTFTASQGVRGFHGQSPSTVDDANVDPLLRNDRRAAAGDAPVHVRRLCESNSAGLPD
jgi:hypothetical protein